MKQNLNEQIARIKSMMKINEDDSQQMAMLQQAAQEFNEKTEEDLTPDELQEVMCFDPENVDLPPDITNEDKQRLEEFKQKIKTASIAELKQAKKQIKEIMKQSKQQQNEQAGAMVTILGMVIPQNFALVLGGFLLLMLLHLLGRLLNFHWVETIVSFCTGGGSRSFVPSFRRRN